MKKVVKDAILVFMICFTLLSIVEFVASKIYMGYGVNMFMQEFEIDTNNLPEQKVELTYSEFAAWAHVLGGFAISQQYFIFIFSAFLGISTSIIRYLKERFLLREILIFFAIGLALIFIYSLIQTIEMGFSMDLFLDEIIFCITDYGIYYVVIYFVIYAIRYTLGKKDAKKLQEVFNKAKE